MAETEEPPLSAAQRSRIRRLSQPKEPEPGDEAGELNVVPYLDIIMNILMFVLASVSVSFVGIHRHHAAGHRRQPRPRRSSRQGAQPVGVDHRPGRLAEDVGRQHRHRLSGRGHRHHRPQGGPGLRPQEPHGVRQAPEERQPGVQGRDAGDPHGELRTSSTRTSSTSWTRSAPIPRRSSSRTSTSERCDERQAPPPDGRKRLSRRAATPSRGQAAGQRRPLQGGAAQGDPQERARAGDRLPQHHGDARPDDHHPGLPAQEPVRVVGVDPAIQGSQPARPRSSPPRPRRRAWSSSSPSRRSWSATTPTRSCSCPAPSSSRSRASTPSTSAAGRTTCTSCRSPTPSPTRARTTS